MFKLFPDGEKYFVDLSGKGEPLLMLNTIIKIAEWCKKKQDEKNVEILPQFVTNGVLLTNSVAELLQKNGVLFGVSVDGESFIHNKHRFANNNDQTFETIIKNISSIPSRQYIGCSATLTNDVFNLVQSIESLLLLFKTISFRPARGNNNFTIKAEKEWEREYNLLAQKLICDMKSGNKTIFLALMNGDDFFGRYLVKAFGKQITLNRCDAGISKFTLNTDGLIYSCPASSMDQDFVIQKPDLRSARTKFLLQAYSCANCDFKFFCGGECQIEFKRKTKRVSQMCNFKKHLILLANLIALLSEVENPLFYLQIKEFVKEKMNRYKKDKELETFLNSHREYTFTKGKELFDSIKKRY